MEEVIEDINIEEKTSKQKAVEILFYIAWIYMLSYYFFEVLVAKYQFSEIMWIDVPTRILLVVYIFFSLSLIPKVVSKLFNKVS